MTALLWAGTWLAACALIALAWPVLAWRRATRGSAARRQASRYASGSAVVALVGTSFACGLSLSWHPANVLAVLLAFSCAGAVVRFAFRMPSLWLVIPVGFSCGAAWLLLGWVMASSNEDYPPLTVQLDNGMLCRSRSEMVLLSDSARELTLYRRFLLVDYRVSRWGNQGNNILPHIDPPEPWRAAFEQCEARADDVLGLRPASAPQPALAPSSAAAPTLKQTRQSPPPASR